MRTAFDEEISALKPSEVLIFVICGYAAGVFTCSESTIFTGISYVQRPAFTASIPLAPLFLEAVKRPSLVISPIESLSLTSRHVKLSSATTIC